MTCPHCQNDVAPSALSCPKCGNIEWEVFVRFQDVECDKCHGTGEELIRQWAIIGSYMGMPKYSHTEQTIEHRVCYKCKGRKQVRCKVVFDLRTSQEHSQTVT